MTQEKQRRPGASDRAPAAPKNELKRHLDQRLDEALEETFPASDPIAVTPPRRRPHDRRASRR